MSKKSISLKPKKEKMSIPYATANDRQAAEKAKIAKAPLVPNRLPFDQGTSI